MSLLALSGIHKAFGAVRALRGVDLELRAGEVHAIVGENGAGKSTLIKVITGVHAADAGTLAIDGAAVAALDPAGAIARGIACVYQQPQLFASLSVAENIALALEPLRPLARVGWGARRERARALLARVGAELDADAPAAALSMAQQQLVELAKALGRQARVLILDEPTASLPAADAQRLLAVVRRLRDAGAGIIFISHRLDEVAAIADRITVLRDGASQGTHAAAGVDRGQLIRLMVGRDVAVAPPARAGAAGDVVLAVRGLAAAHLGPFDLDLRAGEICGVAGLVGAGRTELARLIAGLDPASAGSVTVRGVAVPRGDHSAARRAGIAYLPEDRRRDGIIGALGVAANATLGVLDRICRGGVIDRGRERALAQRAVDAFQVKTASLDTPVAALSGGNQQKVALARCLATDPAVVLLDEPTQGVDVGAKAEIHRLVAGLTDRGAAVLLISSDLSEVLALSDRILVLHRGRNAGALPRGATAEAVMALAFGTAA